MSKLKYDTEEFMNRSYFKNYNAIQILFYFEHKEIEKSIINTYLEHFDLKIREDIINELDDNCKTG